MRSLPFQVDAATRWLECSQSWALAAIGAPAASRAWAIALGIVFAAIAISLLIASWTRWGQSKPLTKCVGIALLAHIWLLLYAYGTRIVSPGIGPGSEGGIATEFSQPAVVAWLAPESDALPDSSAEADDSVAPNADARTSVSPASQPWEKSIVDEKFEHIDAPKLPALPDLSFQASLEATTQEMLLADASIELPSDHSADELQRLADLPIDPSLPPPESAAAAPASNPLAAPPAPPRAAVDLLTVPPAYRMRLSPHRAEFAAANGGDAKTETAVENALMWLARHQSAEGYWDAAGQGAGSEPSASASRESRYRAHAGQRADTAMTGLALLAFLGAGHTHRDGPYAETVSRGLQYLIGQQFPSGDLSGRQQIGQEPTVRYARMYSHGMAALALTEAYAMTHDAALLGAVQGAVGYSLKAMNPRTGGWRYDFASDDPGDTSQFGWQAMVLNSSQNSGAYAIPGATRVVLQRFLDSVSTGRAGGLAVYRNVAPGAAAPVSAATPAMTAEAMAMRCMLGLPIPSQAASEARGMLLAHLPGRSEENLYYWYYASLALYQMRGDPTAPTSVAAMSPSLGAWNQWNDAMKLQLCSTQIVDGPHAGSWHPTCVWGAYGGRVYSTAVACMCLEVYYRYLPLYQEASIASPNAMSPRR